MQKILIYHSIGLQVSSEAGAQLYTVTEEKFREQMGYIVHGPQSTVHSEVAITFDDGDITNYTTAFPILKEFGLKAYFFVLAGKLDHPDYLNSQQLKEMKDAGMIIGSHGMHHKFLTELSDIELDYELRESKQILEQTLGCEVEYLSIPRGFCNNRIISKAKEIGYNAIFASYQENLDGFVFGRISVKYNWNLAHFKNILNNGLSYKERLEEAVKTVSKKILGPRVYDKIRTAILNK
jgi:peptidoglycan/xylan/chitin deacetylase (PgdA/CDA1 family)